MVPMREIPFLLFLGTVVVATVTPGPSMLLALGHGARFGVRRSVDTALGNVCGTALQCGASLLGLGLLVAKFGWALGFLRIAGAIYLVWLGLTILFGRGTPRATEPRRAGGLFAEGLFVTLANPKAIVFFTALFPQFIDEQLTVARGLAMLVTVLAITFVSMMLYAWLGTRAQKTAAHPALRQLGKRVLGGVFIALGIRVACERS
jgi:threonine/homoserine/homoserine lactone efflux protein